jgi:hypothetical protein
MSDGRWVLLIASEVGGTDSVSDRAMERLCEAIQEEGYRVIRTSTPEDGLALVKSDPSFSAILLDWDLTENTQLDERAALKIIRAVICRLHPADRRTIGVSQRSPGMRMGIPGLLKLAEVRWQKLVVISHDGKVHPVGDECRSIAEEVDILVHLLHHLERQLADPLSACARGVQQTVSRVRARSTRPRTR